MIEGLHFDVHYEELNDHLTERAAHHIGRRDFYEQQAQALSEGESLEDRDLKRQYSGQNPVEALLSRAESHHKRYELFTFMRKHLVEETYRLSESDLRTLELIGRGYL